MVGMGSDGEGWARGRWAVVAAAWQRKWLNCCGGSSSIGASLAIAVAICSGKGKKLAGGLNGGRLDNDSWCGGDNGAMRIFVAVMRLAMWINLINAGGSDLADWAGCAVDLMVGCSSGQRLVVVE